MFELGNLRDENLDWEEWDAGNETFKNAVCVCSMDAFIVMQDVRWGKVTKLQVQPLMAFYVFGHCLFNYIFFFKSAKSYIKLGTMGTTNPYIYTCQKHNFPTS